MEITVVGAGGVGGYFGGLLAQAGNNVTVIARGCHLENIRNNGLRVKHHTGEFSVPVVAVDRPGAELRSADLILVAVKTYDLQSVLGLIYPMMGDSTCVLTLQNGVESHDILANALGRNRVLPGVAYIESRIESPGVIVQTGEFVRLVLGEANGQRTVRLQRICDTMRDAGVDCELSEDMLKTLWTKFIFIASLAGLTSVCRTRIGVLLRDENYVNLLMDIIEEVVMVGRAKGIKLDPDVSVKTMRYVETTAMDLVASMHTDLSRGRKLELDALNGSVVRLGREVGVQTPINNYLYLSLKPHMNGGTDAFS